MGSPNSPLTEEIKKRASQSKAMVSRYSRRSLISESKVWLLALFCGLLVGLVMAGLRAAIVGIEFIGFGAQDERITSAVTQLHPLRALLIPVIGGFFVSALLYIGLKLGIRGDPRIGGIRDVIEARRHVLDRRGRTTPLVSLHMSLKDGLQTFLIAVASLGSGASAGREGPAVHVGAVLSGFFAHRFNLTPAQIRALLGCGAAAAVASSFNAPLAGLLFAHEVVLGRYRTSDIGPIAVASVSGSLVTRLIFGNNAVFAPPVFDDPPVIFFIGTPFIGLIAAGLAIVMIRAWVAAPHIGSRFADKIKIPHWMLPPIAGLIIGVFALAYPQVLSVGYEATATAIATGYSAAFMLILAVAKIAATTICIGARFGGGVFSSSIFVGAMVGGVFGAIMAAITGHGEMAQSFFTLVGMGAISGAVLGAPISTTLIVFELTGSYETSAAVLIAVSMATVIVQATVGGGVFEKQIRADRF
ncbi:chloride channel protein [Ponticaulis sp.]|uniref:chloride channel protein n=1 Tax=Ponticaulis sp. TaxID=2020902 RepID=UPI000C35B0AB|nr:chloride channel protein [Ponticaulis sp.]MAJ08965.1 chloride channel core [Ponticaulis sp.]RPG16760.1 MAG: chloride channel protein [Hyphomonadaceae bacterium TMED125]HBH88535.1 chloride channel core [Hyphomonadaceae bacterium]|tara:strand:- start:385 stop:1800 length:1416 start_codon:yes stop_codon:yes gene_type:complete